MTLLDRIKRAIGGSGRSSDQVIPGGGTASAEIGIGQIQDVERGEFPPEEFTSGENDESE